MREPLTFLCNLNRQRPRMHQWLKVGVLTKLIVVIEIAPEYGQPDHDGVMG